MRVRLWKTGAGRQSGTGRLSGTPRESARELDMKRPPAPPILRTAKTVGTGLLAAVALLITGTEASAAPTRARCSAAALACVDVSSQQAWLLQAGTVRSNGCVHLTQPAAQTFYNTLHVGDEVQVVG
jgi:hypothetical protein